MASSLPYTAARIASVAVSRRAKPGPMDARSPYAEAGALLAVLVWLHYEPCIVLIGADFTKALKERTERKRVHATG